MIFLIVFMYISFRIKGVQPILTKAKGKQVERLEER